MAGLTLNIASTLQCPHGGAVQIITTNARVQAGGAFAALSTDQFIVTGCPFQIPVGAGTIPSPCITVQWAVSDVRSSAGAGTLSMTSVGVCLNAQQVPQGMAVISNAQPSTQSM